MGSVPTEEGSFKNERPRHEVRILSPFQIAAVPVTIAQYAAFDPGHRSDHHQGKVPDEKLATHPVESVTWYQAFAFCRWLSASLPWAKGARLPTEEEWEYACRAETESRYWSGNKGADLNRVGWYDANSKSHAHRVGRKAANPWGLYDVHGNVWEWTVSKMGRGLLRTRRRSRGRLRGGQSRRSCRGQRRWTRRPRWQRLARCSEHAICLPAPLGPGGRVLGPGLPRVSARRPE